MIPFPDKINIGSLIGCLLHLSDHIKACVHGLLYFKDMLFVLSFLFGCFLFYYRPSRSPSNRWFRFGAGVLLFVERLFFGEGVLLFVERLFFGVGVLLFVERLLFGAAVVFFVELPLFCMALLFLPGLLLVAGRSVAVFFMFLRGFVVALPFDGGGVWGAAGTMVKGAVAEGAVAGETVRAGGMVFREEVFFGCVEP